MLGMVEKDTKHLGSFTLLIHFEHIRHPQLKPDENLQREPYLSWKPGEKDITTPGPLPCQGQRALLNLG